ncbi:MAG: hypothetical protein QOE93_2043 [Actinomycetota bacterium]|nr:hypothetical protein [Actinomycetota bacterium]
MASTRIRIAVAGMAMAMLGGVACRGGDGQADRGTTPPRAETPAPEVASISVAPAPAVPAVGTDAATPDGTTATPPPGARGEAPAPSAPETPSVDQVQALITAMTAQLQAAAARGPGAPPPTSEEIQALTTATADLTNKTTDLVNAMVTHIQTVDAGGNVASTLAVVNARIPAYADSAAVWVAKWHDLDTAQLQAQNLVMQQGVLNGLTSGLCVL